MIWLGAERGYLTDWLTQSWVRVSGRFVRIADYPWLDGPAGGTAGIGAEFFVDYARRMSLDVRQTGRRGLIQSFSELAGDGLDVSAIHPPVRDFYEATSEYELDAWAEWHGLFRPFGKALAVLFSRRLQQLNVPLSALDTSRGMTSDVIQFLEPQSGRVALTAWVRRLLSTENVLYAGAYSVCRLPDQQRAAVKVVFPLPNGYAIVMMKPEVHEDGSLSVISAGRGFGDYGFYFVVRDARGAWVRYVATMKESIHVYGAEEDTVRADHVLWFWGVQFLRLHYRMRRRSELRTASA